MKDLPKWFIEAGGAKYKNGGAVSNPFSSESTTLNSNELSMYDFIIGCQMVSADKSIQTQFRKAIDWFRVANPEAYMILLD